MIATGPALAGIVGFLGNEGVAIFRIRVGREIGSAALVADGYHARVDGWTSLAVVLGALGIWAGYPLADPIVGVLIAGAIVVLVWQSARSVVLRVLDGVETATLDAIGHAARQVEGRRGRDHLGRVNVHVDPSGQSGEVHHRIGEHVHDGLPRHVHD